MFETVIEPRFGETDALGHINNAVVPAWFEQGRKGIFELFNPSLDLTRWNLILRKYEIDFERQIRMYHPVTVVTTIEHIGNSSFGVLQVAYQNGEVVATGRTVMVHFNYETGKPEPIPAGVKTLLEPHRSPAE